jgi:hypothetical protein
MTRRETLFADPAARMTEAELMRLVTDAAELYGWSWAHFRPAMTSHGWRTAVSGPLGAGFVDLFMVRPRDKRLLFVECKSDGGRIGEAQAVVHDVLRSAGLDVRVVRPGDPDDLLQALR